MYIPPQTPNRRLDLHIPRPDAFSSPSAVDAYYRALEPFMTALYRIDADISLI